MVLVVSPSWAERRISIFRQGRKDGPSDGPYAESEFSLIHVLTSKSATRVVKLERCPFRTKDLTYDPALFSPRVRDCLANLVCDWDSFRGHDVTFRQSSSHRPFQAVSVSESWFDSYHGIRS